MTAKKKIAPEKFVLPEWDTVHEKFKSGVPLNPLELFIFDQEPAGPAEIGFREGLQATIEFIREGHNNG